MGYHKIKIPKGKLGEFSKITEEYMELFDAHEQDVHILELCELCDLIGAIELYSKEKFNISLEDLIKMKNLTSDAFNDGSRH